MKFKDIKENTFFMTNEGNIFYFYEKHSDYVVAQAYWINDVSPGKGLYYSKGNVMHLNKAEWDDALHLKIGGKNLNLLEDKLKRKLIICVIRDY